MTDKAAFMLWRRLDTPGHDACRLEQRDGAWQLEGTAVFLHQGAPARLDYRVTSDLAWRSQRGEVRGWLGPQAVAIDVARTVGGTWTQGGAVVPGLERCLDLDYGFSPATNILQLRRCDLAVGQAADVPVAWLDPTGSGTLELLPQRYERRTATTTWYDAPSVPYAALLELAPSGFVRLYPGLWEAAT
jgi:uncharacterized protein